MKTTPVWIGFATWLIIVALHRPDLTHDIWAAIILQFAALVLVQMIPDFGTATAKWRVLATAIALTVAFYLPQGLWAGLLTLPWLAVTLWQFKTGIDWLIQRPRTADQVALASGRIFMVVGGLWTFSDRMGWRPLDFDPAIVLLTGVHFHYAGLIFPTLAGLAAARWPSRQLTLACWLAVIAVPLTAIGITIAQIAQSFVFEALAATTVAVAGWLTAISYIQIILTKALPAQVRVVWLLLAIALLFSMTLALGYALRPYYPLEILNIPNMRAWHGTANAFGVAGAGLLGWAMLKTTIQIP